MPAQATANSVMASAKRLIELRQDCRSNSRMAEISVPAWPMPIHQTKLTIANPQPIGIVDAPDAGAFDEQIADREQHHHREQEGDAKADEPAVGGRAGQDDRADLVGDRAKGISRLDDRCAFV